MPWAVAAAAVAAGGSYMSAKEANKGSKVSGDPAYVESAKQTALDKAKAISDKPYTPYTGQRVADISGNERQASELSRTGGDKALGYMDQAGSELGKLSEFSGDAISKYTNPYIESVLQPQLREANTTYEKERNRLNNSKAGALGGDRGAFAESELERTHQQNVADLTGKTYAEAFESAKSSFFNDQDRHIRAGQAYQSLAGDTSRMNTQQIQDLMATGSTDRLLSQAKLDFNYQQFTENRDWDTTNLKPLLDAIGAAKGTPLQDNNKASPWGQAIGAAATVAGAYFTGGGNLGKSPSPGSAGSGKQANDALNNAGFGGGYSTPQLQVGP